MIKVFNLANGEFIEKGKVEEISQKYFNNNCLVISFQKMDTIYNARINRIFKKVTP